MVESVSAELVASTSGSLYTMQLNDTFTLFMIPTLISDKVFQPQALLRHAFNTLLRRGRQQHSVSSGYHR